MAPVYCPIQIHPPNTLNYIHSTSTHSWYLNENMKKKYRSCLPLCTNQINIYQHEIIWKAKKVYIIELLKLISSMHEWFTFAFSNTFVYGYIYQLGRENCISLYVYPFTNSVDFLLKFKLLVYHLFHPVQATSWFFKLDNGRNFHHRHYIGAYGIVGTWLYIEDVPWVCNMYQYFLIHKMVYYSRNVVLITTQTMSRGDRQTDGQTDTQPFFIAFSGDSSCNIIWTSKLFT